MAPKTKTKTKTKTVQPPLQGEPADKPGASKASGSIRPAAGHLDPGHVARLRRLSKETNAIEADVGFVAGPRSKDELTERLGEEAVSSMTSGESQLADDWDRPVEEEDGGPFVETSASDEFAMDTDASDVADATREPFPKTSSAR